jgi:hypothetical protein
MTESLRAVPSLLRMKLAVELRAVAWSFVPVYGLIQGLRHRVGWAMASNVLVFERLTGGPGCERCLEIADGPHRRSPPARLVLAPFLPTFAVVLGWAVLATWVEHGYCTRCGIVFAVALAPRRTGVRGREHVLSYLGSWRARAAASSRSSPTPSTLVAWPASAERRYLYAIAALAGPPSGSTCEATEAGLRAPAAEVGERVVEGVAELDQHVERHEQAELMRAARVVDQVLDGDECARLGQERRRRRE